MIFWGFSFIIPEFQNKLSSSFDNIFIHLHYIHCIPHQAEIEDATNTSPHLDDLSLCIWAFPRSRIAKCESDYFIYLETDLYSKPTDTHQYLQWSSCHPRHTKESLPYSLAFRLRRICSTDGAFAIRIDQLKEYLSIRGYPANVIQKQIQKAKDISRSEALQPHQSKKKNKDRVPLVMTYDPSHSSISSTIQKYLPILHSSRCCKDAIPKPPMVAFRRPINIKDMVVRSSIRVPSAEPPGFNPCKNCAACKHTHNSSVVEHTVTSHTFSSHSSGQQFTIKHHLHCLSTNVVYLINCKKCGFQYIGETKRTLKTRLLEHCGDTKPQTWQTSR